MFLRLRRGYCTCSLEELEGMSAKTKFPQATCWNNNNFQNFLPRSFEFLFVPCLKRNHGTLKVL